MNKTYTTEEIIRRLKAGESVTCITNDSLNFAKGNNYKYSHAIGDMIHFYVNSIPIGVDINKFSDYFMFTSDRNNIKFSTRYTEKEILERLTNGETITAINPCTFVNSKVDQFNVGKTYIPYGDKGRFIFVEYFTVISNVDVNHKVFIKDLCDYFMFTSDYEAMKSEEKGMEAAYKTIQEEKKLPFVNLGLTTLIDKDKVKNFGSTTQLPPTKQRRKAILNKSNLIKWLNGLKDSQYSEINSQTTEDLKAFYETIISDIDRLWEDQPQIPEWLQRERVRFWGNRFGEYKAAYMKNTEDAISMANEDLEQFDKRFLNNNDGK